jgi:hypothetical protein
MAPLRLDALDTLAVMLTDTSSLFFFAFSVSTLLAITILANREMAMADNTSQRHYGCFLSIPRGKPIV